MKNATLESGSFMARLELFKVPLCILLFPAETVTVHFSGGSAAFPAETLADALHALGVVLTCFVSGGVELVLDDEGVIQRGSNPYYLRASERP